MTSVKKQKTSVRNFYETIPKPKPKEEYNPNFDSHHIDMPFRALLVGASGSMKTNTVLDMIEKFNGSFEQITVVCRNKDEPLYKLLRDSLDSSQVTFIEIEMEDLSQIPTLTGQDSESPHKLVIFDDLCLIKDQRPICEFFIRARKLNISCCYLTQSYFMAPKTIRCNCNLVILKKIDNVRDLRLLLSEYSLSIELDQLVQLYTRCTEDKLDFLMIIMSNDESNRFFHNYTPVDCEGNEIETPEKTSEKTSEPEKPSDDPDSTKKASGFENFTPDEMKDLYKRFLGQ